MSTATMTRRHAETAAEPAEPAPHAGHYVQPHDHRYQPKPFPRCSSRFWCATCREWLDGPRCDISRNNYGLRKW